MISCNNYKLCSKYYLKLFKIVPVEMESSHLLVWFSYAFKLLVNGV